MSKVYTIVVENEILKLGRVHKGYKHERTKHPDNYLEKLFQKKWKEENKVRSYINYGYGCLQDLFCWYEQKFLPLRRTRFKLITNARDQYIAATVIQWLGTNCGFAFLLSVLKEAGYEIKLTEKGEKLRNRQFEKSFTRTLLKKSLK